jgi:hypothetical protein
VTMTAETPHQLYGATGDLICEWTPGDDAAVQAAAEAFARAAKGTLIARPADPGAPVAYEHDTTFNPSVRTYSVVPRLAGG